MHKTRNALLGVLTMMSGAILAVPTDAAERYNIPGGYVYKAGPERLFSYPYGGTYLRVDYSRSKGSNVIGRIRDTGARAGPLIAATRLGFPRDGWSLAANLHNRHSGT